MKKNWWKEGVIYQIYPRSFKDSNGDGIGDIKGIISKLDYLQSLNVDIIWLSPVYKSPNDDNGYDISDYRGIMDEFGTMEDFDEMLQGIQERGMKLVMDLVVNHSSDEHEWFQESRSSKDNSKRDYYIWRPGKEGKPPTNWKSFFSGSAWEYDETTDEYYLHLFTKKQPDLNWENPKVRQEVYDSMSFWLDKGIDGFRMDVIPLISKRELVDTDLDEFNEVIEKVYSTGPRVHEFLSEMHQQVISKYDMMTVGEGPGITPERVYDYVGASRKELDMVFHFGHMFIDHGPGGKYDVKDFTLQEFKRVFEIWDKAVGEDGWLSIFLDNHDFPRMVSRFGNDNKYHQKSAKLLAMLITTLRGTPCIYQGSEIGMTNVAFPSFHDYRDVELKNELKEWKQEGRDIDMLLKAAHRQGRDNVRTPMQWSNQPNADFTSGDPWIKINPNYTEINVRSQEEDPNSILNFYRELLAMRKLHPTLVYGHYQCIHADDPKVFSYWRWDDTHTYLCLLNMSDYPQQFAVDSRFEFDELTPVIINTDDLPEKKSGKTFDLLPWQAVLYKL
ncbi:MAG: alpha-glucosidase [Cyclobacteriaceae bacterium]